ncbi:putative copper chaperone CsoZ [Staphylococcus sp. 11261D007BR]
MQQSTVLIKALNTEEDQQRLMTRLNDMTGVEQVTIDMANQTVKLSYETPMNLNTLEKEIYDAGFPVIDAY